MKILLAMLLWSTAAPLFRRSGLSFSTYTFSANLIGFLILLPFYGKRIVRGIEARRVPFLLLSGLFLAANVLLFLKGFLYAEIAHVLIPHYIAPVIVVLLSPFFLDERPGWIVAPALLLASGALVLVGLDARAEGGGEMMIGVALGALSGLAYAGLILSCRYLAREGVDPMTMTACQIVPLTIVVLPWVDPGELTGVGISAALAAGFLHIGLAAPLFMKGSKYYPASTVGILGYSEVGFGMLLGVLVEGEPLTWMKITAALLVLISGLLVLRGLGGDRLARKAD